MDMHLYRVHIWVGPVVEFAELDALYLQKSNNSEWEKLTSYPVNKQCHCGYRQ
jgi:hypothetical protein